MGVTKSNLRVTSRADSPIFWLTLIASSVVLHGVVLLAAVRFAHLFSPHVDSPVASFPVDLVELPPDLPLEDLTNPVGAPVPAPVAKPAEPAATEVLPTTLPPSSNDGGISMEDPPASTVPPSPVLPPSPVATPSPIATPSPVFTPTTAPVATQSPSATPSPSVTPTTSPVATPFTSPSADAPVLATPPTARVQPIQQATPSGLAEPQPEAPPPTEPNLPPIRVAPEVMAAQVVITVTMLQGDGAAMTGAAPANPAGRADLATPQPVTQRWVFEPNPLTSSCSAITPGIVRQLGTSITFQVDLGPDGLVMGISPQPTAESTVDAADYTTFLQCVVTEQWRADPAQLTGGVTEGKRVVIVVMAEANNSAP